MGPITQLLHLSSFLVSWFSTYDCETCWNFKGVQFDFSSFNGTFQAKSLRGSAAFLIAIAIVEKKLQNELVFNGLSALLVKLKVMLDISSVGNIFFIAFQNFEGILLFSLKRLSQYFLLASLIMLVHRFFRSTSIYDHAL